MQEIGIEVGKARNGVPGGPRAKEKERSGLWERWDGWESGCRGVLVPDKGVQGSPHARNWRHWESWDAGSRSHCAQERRVAGVHTLKERGVTRWGDPGRSHWGFWGSPVLKKGVLGVGKGRNGVEEKRRGLDVWDKGGQENGL